MQTPNPQTHFQISIIKSIFRIIAGIALCMTNFIGAGICLILAELLGIAEELF